MTAVRQPFAPLDEARLQNLTSTKNRQNALLSPSNMKRKAAESCILDDSENVDPTSLFSKRSKNVASFSPLKSGLKLSLKKHLFATPSLPTPRPASFSCDSSPLPPSALSRSRTLLKPKAPSTKARATTARRSLPALPAFSTNASGSSSPLASRTSGRGGILQTKRRVTSFAQRGDASSKLASALSASAAASAVPFSLDAALKGTLSAYASTSALPKASASSAAVPTSLSLGESDMDASWFFNIHEDTPEQEMTNMLQHSTCVLDISSDEETEQKARHARAEGRDKENIPPPNDVSQTSRSRPGASMAASASGDSMLVEKARNPLSQLNAADFYELGCDETSVVLVPSDEEIEEVGAETAETLLADNKLSTDSVTTTTETTFVTESTETTPSLAGLVDAPSAEELMSHREKPAAEAAVLEPIEGTGESFEVWESGSFKEDDECTPALAATTAELAATASC